jgi:protein-S-isoprenylcysteine O-methyltransferase Ste14
MKTILPPTYLLLSLMLMVSLWALVPGPHLIESPWNLIGIGPAVLGVCLNVVGDRQFQRARTPIHPFSEPRALVTTGVFRYVRHPMYLGMVLLEIGLAILLGYATPFAAPILLWAVLRAGFIHREEVAMSKRFGAGYESYRARVRRWL